MARPRHVAEYVALRGALMVAGVLPYGVALRLAAAAARILFDFGWRRSEAMRRVAGVLGAGAAAEKIAREGLRHFFWAVVDAVYAPRHSPEWVRRHFRVEGEDHLRRALAEGRGAVLAVPHLGSWEMAGMLGPLFGYRLVALVARQRNPLVDRHLVRWRARRGVTVVPRGGTATRRILRALAEGAVLAMPVDLRSPRPGVRAVFLGREANLAGGLAFFAELGHAPVLPCAVWRTSTFDHTVRIWPAVRPPSEGSRHERRRRLLQDVLDVLTPVILERPEQYFWYNRRWVLDPLPAAGDAPAGRLSRPARPVD
ncbi:MAG: lysophospholipid acyltransferase family protein [Kiritimatiellae bacterium]|nr:lysophospholipid acyltransferase family protein [Kiritimatiellia bacterium]